jgi:hypothetical protein
MARIYGIKKALAENNIDGNLAKEIIGNSDLIDVIGRMEGLLDPETTHMILDSCACGGGKEYIEQLKKTGREIADKSLHEKIDHINKISPDSEKVILNADNTITTIWSFGDDGKYKCVCSASVKKGIKVSDIPPENDQLQSRVMPLMYCYCCAGSGRRHLQLQLGVELKTKEIVSTPINSGGKKLCEIVFEIV